MEENLKFISLFMMLAVSVMLNAGCNSTGSSAGGATNSTNAVIAIRVELYVWVDKLNVRSLPDPDQKAFTNLAEGTKVVYFGEMSMNEATYVLRGNKITSYFVNVQMPDGSWGWVFYGALTSNKVYSPAQVMNIHTELNDPAIGELEFLAPGANSKNAANTKTGDVWFALIDDGMGCLLEKTKIKIAPGEKDTITAHSDSVVAEGKKILFFVRGIALKEGYVQTVRCDQSIDQGTDLQYQNYKIYVYSISEFQKNKWLSQISDWQLGLSSQELNASTGFHHSQFMTNMSFKIVWSGDIDRDGSPDFLFNIREWYVESYVEYYKAVVSSPKSDDKWGTWFETSITNNYGVETAIAQAVVWPDEATLYAEPSGNSAPVEILKSGDTVSILGKEAGMREKFIFWNTEIESDFLYVRLKSGVTGWVPFAALMGEKWNGKPDYTIPEKKIEQKNVPEAQYIIYSPNANIWSFDELDIPGLVKGETFYSFGGENGNFSMERIKLSFTKKKEYLNEGALEGWFTFVTLDVGNPLLLIKGMNFPTGAVKTYFSGLSGYINDGLFELLVKSPETEYYIEYESKVYGSGDHNVAVAGSMRIYDKAKKVVQEIVPHGVVDSIEFFCKWAGDMNGDGKMDMFVVVLAAESGSEAWDAYLLLSSSDPARIFDPPLSFGIFLVD